MKKIISFALIAILLILSIPALLFLPACNQTPEPLPETMLIWALPNQNMHNEPFPYQEQWERIVARAISERGGNFGVKTLPVGLEVATFGAIPNDDFVWYTELIADKIQNGQQIDIASIYSNNRNNRIGDAYHKMYQSGLTLALDDFLHGDGSGIYEMFPPVIWDALRINGSINGFFWYGTIDTGTKANIILHQSLAEHINTYELTNNFLDLIEIIEELPNELGITRSVNDFSTTGMAHFFNMVTATSAIGIQDGRALSFLEDDLFKAYIEFLHSVPAFDFANFICEEEGILDLTMVIQLGSDEPVIPYFVQEGVVHIPVAEQNIFSLDSALIINPKSNYTAEALQLMTWLHTDQEFADLFTYGQLGDYFVYENGFINNIEQDEPPLCGNWPRLATFGTAFTATPFNFFELEKDLSAISMAHFRSLESAPNTGFRFDRRGFEELVTTLDNIIYDYLFVFCPDIAAAMEYPVRGELFRNFYPSETRFATYTASPFALGDDPDWEQTLANLNADLRAAGIGELIDEVQRQYDEWFALHSPVNR